MANGLLAVLLWAATLTGPAAPAPLKWPDPAGWTATAVRSYDARTLFQAINGAAEVFLDYGFQQLVTRRYTRDPLTVEVGVYDMGRPLHAFGVFGVERPAKAAPLVAGARAAASLPHQCLMLEGRFYIKMDVLQGQLAEDECKSLLGALAEALPGEAGLPPELDLLPKADRVTGSEGYARQSFLGVGDLGNCVHARYRSGEQEYGVFLLLPDPLKSTDDIWKGLSDKWQRLDRDGVAIATRAIPYRGTVALARTDQGVYGITDAGDLDTTVTRLLSLLSASTR